MRAKRIYSGITRVATVAAIVSAAASIAVSPASASASASAQRGPCGYIGPTWTDDPAYEHCATDTNVWIRVDRVFREDYERCVGPGRTKLDKDARFAWYIGQLCDHPGDTRGI
jgi:hypothetical protein